MNHPTSRATRPFFNSLLGAGAAAAEIGKVLRYTSKGDYTKPTRVLVCHTLGGDFQIFQDMLNSPERLRGYILDNWDERCSTKITSKTKIELVDELKAHIQGFDSSIFRAKQPLDLINDMEQLATI